MSTAILVSPEEFLATAFHPDRDYIDGETKERNVGEWDHSSLQGLLIVYLGSRRKQLHIHVVPEQRVQVTPTRFRVPDVCVVAGDRPTEQVLTKPPHLCVEILSKDDTMSDMEERIADYLHLGVPFVWLIDPRTRRAFVYSGTTRNEVTDGVLRTSNPSIGVPIAELFD
jgi:Uma2 family endonuclease